jgi:8-oxo-dGTP pyrophosphatase MutT (NUDIX family)
MADKRPKRNVASVRAGTAFKSIILARDASGRRINDDDDDWEIQLSKKNKRLSRRQTKSRNNVHLLKHHNIINSIITIGQKQIPKSMQWNYVSQTKKKPVKHSAGIACMRKNPYNNQLEVLLIKRRYTYAYAEFMNGSYYPADFRRNSIGETRLINLFSEMTTEDKVLIMGMNFSSMWYHIWMSKNKSRQYYMVKSRFEAAFKSDNGKRLREMISSAGNGRHIWDIPKGRPNYENEGDVRCAVREFEEETGIDKSNYVIYPEVKKKHSYTDKGVVYDFIYFLAFTKYEDAQINIISREQLSEVGDIKWMDIHLIRAIDEKKRLENILRPLMSYMKKRINRCIR